MNLIATPEPGFTFVSWTRGTTTVGTSPALSYNAGAGGYNANPIANFVATRTITTTGGTASDGSPVTVTATGNTGYAFSEWTEGGVQVSTSASYTFTAMADRTLVANFVAVPTYNIITSAAPVAGGTTSGGGIVNEGSSITLIATPNAGFTFANWTEGGAQVSTNASYTFTVTTGRTLVANFNPLPTYTVTANTTPAAGGTAIGGGPYLSGTSVTLTATPSAGYVFWKWTVGGNLVSVASSYTFTVVANFAAIGVSRTITTSANPTAGGTHISGNSATVVATPNPGYIFTRWQEGGVDVSTSASYTITVAGNRTLTARFSPGFIITAIAAPAVGGTVSGAGIYNLGSDVTVSAARNPGYAFQTWTLDGSAVSWERNYIFTADGNYALIAWPADATGWVLQESIDLIEWWDSALESTLIGTDNTVTIGTGDKRYFFRLVYSSMSRTAKTFTLEARPKTMGRSAIRVRSMRGGICAFPSAHFLRRMPTRRCQASCFTVSPKATAACNAARADGSTHAEFPAAQRNDNVQSVGAQGHAGVLAECTACHVTMPRRMRPRRRKVRMGCTRSGIVGRRIIPTSPSRWASRNAVSATARMIAARCFPARPPIAR